MAEILTPRDSRSRPAPDGAGGPRRARVQAAWLLAALIPAATLAGFMLAEAAGARAPAVSAVATLALALTGGAAVLRGLGGPLYPHARLGLCNVVTLLRAAGIAVLAGLTLAPPTLGWGLVFMAGLVLSLDLVDGWLARRSGLASAFGARFDVETDVLFAIVLSLLAWQAGKVGVWFLALGALRPAFLLASALWPRLKAPLPEAMWRKTVAATQMILQVALIAPVLSPPLSQLLGAAILAGVTLSFAVDVRWLMARAGPKA